MDEILQILREEEATLNLPIETRMDGINEAFYSSHREEKLCDNIWILDSGASCHIAKQSVWFKNISPEVMDIYLADKELEMFQLKLSQILELLHADLCGPINIESHGGAKYFMIAKQQFSGLRVPVLQIIKAYELTFSFYKGFNLRYCNYKLEYVQTEFLIADFLTKAMNVEKLEYSMQKIALLS
ncbi:retrovirus-related Pol polyprotein from transposon TNT 1-94 [Trichonephila clavipes]|nr:retrovirus-related Pol polyprotein from transposon TNT 1-94 [Trichonephila clavipes]